MYYVFKFILENKDKGISAKEIQERLEDYEIYLDIKTVYSCIHQINDFFYEWLHENMITSIKKSWF